MPFPATFESMADRRAHRPSDLHISSASHPHPFVHHMQTHKASRYAPARQDRGSMGSEASAPGLMDDQASDVSADDDYQDPLTAAGSWDAWPHAAFPTPGSATRSPDLFFNTAAPSSSPLFSPTSLAAVTRKPSPLPRAVGHEAFISHKATDSFSRRHMAENSPTTDGSGTTSGLLTPSSKVFEFNRAAYLLPPQLPPPTTPLPQLPSHAPRTLRAAKSHGVLMRTDMMPPPRSASLARPTTPPAGSSNSAATGRAFGPQHQHSGSSSSTGSRTAPRRPQRPDEKVSYSPFPPADPHQRNSSQSSTTSSGPRARPSVGEDELMLHQMMMGRVSQAHMGHMARPSTAGVSGLGRNINMSAFDVDDSEDDAAEPEGSARAATGLQRLMKGLQKRTSQEKCRESSKEKNVFHRMFARSK